MHSGLRQRFGNDGGLLELDTESQMNQRVQEAGIQAYEHVVCVFSLRKEVLLQCVLPALVVDLLLEEDEEIMIIVFLSQVDLEALRLMHVVYNRLLELFGRSLVRHIDVVGFLQFFGRGIEGEEGENVVSYVILYHNL
jgi:hypothetical protein